MNQTHDPVFGPGQSVELTVLGQATPPMTATVVDMTGPALRLRTPQSLAIGTAVKIEGADILLLADVNFCDAAPDGPVVGLTVRHMLTALAELTRLGRALRGEQYPVAEEQKQPAAAEPETVPVRRRSPA